MAWAVWVAATRLLLPLLLVPIVVVPVVRRLAAERPLVAPQRPAEPPHHAEPLLLVALRCHLPLLLTTLRLLVVPLLPEVLRCLVAVVLPHLPALLLPPLLRLLLAARLPALLAVAIFLPPFSVARS